jgi:acetyltransferase-like isoleucine patch superfamily enzyme
MSKRVINTKKNDHLSGLFRPYWIRFWMRHAGMSKLGRFATRMATWLAPPHKAGTVLANLNPKGYIAPTATLYHSDLQLGAHILIADRVMIFQNKAGGAISIGDRVSILRDTTLETGFGGYLIIGDETWIHPRCQINAYKAPIEIGCGVDIAPNCALYSYDHGFAPDKTIRQQPLQTKGKITIDDHAWLGVGVIVLSGVCIGKGAVIGAGALVTKDIPENAIAAGKPARVLKLRSNGVRSNKKN